MSEPFEAPLAARGEPGGKDLRSLCFGGRFMSDPSRLPSRLGAIRVNMNVRPPKENPKPMAEDGAGTMLSCPYGRAGRRHDGGERQEKPKNTGKNACATNGKRNPRTGPARRDRPLQTQEKGARLSPSQSSG